MSLLDLNSQLAAMTAPAAAAAPRAPAANAADRPKSDFWLNVGVVLPGAGENGADLFASPFGLAMDDLKQKDVRDGNTPFGQLVQLENTIREMAQKQAAALAPGEYVDVPLFTVRIYRKKLAGAPQGDANSNPLLAQFTRMIAGEAK